MKDDDIVHPDNVILGLNYVLGVAHSQGSRRTAPIVANAIAEIERLRAENADLDALVRLALATRIDDAWLTSARRVIDRIDAEGATR
jgi:hypothetical protein